MGKNILSLLADLKEICVLWMNTKPLDSINTNTATMRVYGADSQRIINTFSRVRPYLKNRLLDPIAYPVSGVDMPGHFCEFIGPRWWLPFGPGPLARRRILNCLLQFRCGVRGPKTRVVCAELAVTDAVCSCSEDAARPVTTRASRATVQLLNRGHQKLCF